MAWQMCKRLTQIEVRHSLTLDRRSLAINTLLVLIVTEEVHLVYDRYDEKGFVKGDERSSRMKKAHVKTYTVLPNFILSSLEKTS